MILVVAAGANDTADICARLDQLGAGAPSIAAPSERRRLVLATVDNPAEAGRVAELLRDEGYAAIARPADGPALEAWMRHTQPIRVGGRLTVCFAWSEHDCDDSPGLIELGPGGFGNGEHPTTRMLLEVLIERVRGGERVLDVGCGTGVLGLGALELGASRVTAVDLKPEAIAATRRNAAWNAMGQRVDATVEPLHTIAGSFDAIVANIGRGAAVELAPQLRRLLRPGGWLAVSGISPSQCSLIAGFLRPLVEVDQRTSGEWAAVVLAQDDQ